MNRFCRKSGNSVPYSSKKAHYCFTAFLRCLSGVTVLLPAHFPSVSRSAHSCFLRTSQAAELKSHHHALWWQHFSAYLQAVMFTSFLKLLCFNYNFTIKMPLRFCSYKSAPCLTERQGALKSCILNPSISTSLPVFKLHSDNR